MGIPNATPSQTPLGGEREVGSTPVISVDKGQQIRRLLSEAAVTVGFVGVAIDAYRPDIIKLAPDVRWLPAALAGLGLVVKLWHKYEDLRNITHV